jgi:acetylornithine aminotransferase/acetylornithine/N-succinyldiaminopimelate aminotransferase
MLAHIREVGGYFKAHLQALSEKHECISDVRGMGLMLGLELNSTELAEAVAAEMLRRKIIINRTSDNVLRFLPPYILERKHVDVAIAALDEILTGSVTYAGASPEGEHANG